MCYASAMKSETDLAIDQLANMAGIPFAKAKAFHALLVSTMIDPSEPRIYRCAKCDSVMLGRRSHATYCSDRCRVAASRERRAA